MIKQRAGWASLGTTALLAAAAILLSSSGLAEAQNAAPSFAGTATYSVPAPKTVHLSSLPTIAGAELAARLADGPKLKPRRDGLTDAQRRQRLYQMKHGGSPASKQSAATGAATTDGSGPLAPPQTPGQGPNGGQMTPQATTTFTGQVQSECGGYYPADMALAVGDTTNSVLQINNDCLSVYSKTGTRVLGPVSLQTFAGLPSTEFVSDPRAFYDWTNHRYVLVFIHAASDNATSWFYTVAATTADDPTGTWSVQANIQTGNDIGNVPDYPRLGQDRIGVYVASNLFDTTTGLFQKEEWLLLPKAQLEAGTAFQYNVVTGPQLGNRYVDSSQPANVQSPYDQPRAEFFVTSLNINFNSQCYFAPCNGLIVWAVSNPLVATGSPGPELSGVFIPTPNNYSYPPPANQPLGGDGSIDAGDTRISGSVVYQSGQLYAALSTDSSAIAPTFGTGTPAALLFRIQPALNDNNDVRCTGTFANQCPRITDGTSNTLTFGERGFTETGGGVYYPTVQPDLEGNWSLIYNYSSSATYPSTVYLSLREASNRNFRFADGSVRSLNATSFYAAQGQAFYSAFRWGDYTATAPAGIIAQPGLTPALPTTWWAGMWGRPDGTWGTVIGKNGYNNVKQLTP